MIETKFLNMREAGQYIGQSYRWMQRNYVNLIKHGVKTFRVPKDSIKGHLRFHKDDLDKYMESCLISTNFEMV